MPKHDPENQCAANFSLAVLNKAQQLSNLTNLSELTRWLQALGEERLAPFRALPDTQDAARAVKADLWLKTVGRNAMIRQGERQPWSPSAAQIAKAPAWVGWAVSRGETLSKLTLSARERATLESVLDWLAASDGPPESSDWSRVSLAQAVSAEKAWIAKRAKAASKTNAQKQADEGTTVFLTLDEPGFENWRWELLSSPSALELEGARMRHCVGSYSAREKAGSLQIYSLRTSEGESRLTVEARQDQLIQLKAFANQACPKEWEPAVDAFVRAWESALKQSPASLIGDDFRPLGWEVAFGLGAVKKDKPLRPDYRLAIAKLIKTMPSLIKQQRFEDDEDPLSPLQWQGFKTLLMVNEIDPAMRFFKAIQQLNPHQPESDAIDEFPDMSERPSPVEIALKLTEQTGSAKALERLAPLCECALSKAQALLCAVSLGQIDLAQQLANDRDAFALAGEEALDRAAKKGQADMVRLLIQKGTSRSANTRALFNATSCNHPEAVKELAPFSYADAGWSSSLREAARCGFTEVARALISRSDPTAYDCEALREAAERGHIELATLLIPASELSTTATRVLAIAAKGEQAAAVSFIALHCPAEAELLAIEARANPELYCPAVTEALLSLTASPSPTSDSTRSVGGSSLKTR